MYPNYSPEFYRGVELFNLEEFYAQHDQFEDIWRKTSKDNSMRLLYQGILNIGVGFYHFKRNNFVGNKRQLTKGIARLKQFHQVLMTHKGIDQNTVFPTHWLVPFINAVEYWYKWFETADEYYDYPPFPKILIY